MIPPLYVPLVGPKPLSTFPLTFILGDISGDIYIYIQYYIVVPKR
jgi:hypothetical protein